MAIREDQEDRLRLLYDEVDAVDGDESTRLPASKCLAQEIAGGISASFVEPWP
ncbi:MAG: hypothetical protein ACJ8H8_32230 [Geminicoccaceae bacterium]